MIHSGMELCCDGYGLAGWVEPHRSVGVFAIPILLVGAVCEHLRTAVHTLLTVPIGILQSELH